MTKDLTRQGFLDAAQNKNILSAYLIICSRINVAARLANVFLMNLYCKNGGCGKCTDCTKVKEGHVDIMRLSAPKVAEFREAISFIAEKPVDGVFKAVVIENADNMTESAANSMLKTLEEPPQNVVLLLEARSISGVLPTIASRCSAVYLTPDTNAKNTIVSLLDVDKDTAHILYDLSGGFVDEAKWIFNDKEFWELRAISINHCKQILRQKGMAISTYVDFLEQNKDRIVDILGVMQSYYCDILVYQKSKNANLIINRDESKAIRETALHFTSGAISNMIRIILETERRFFFAVNFRLAVEKMLFDILEEISRWKK